MRFSVLFNLSFCEDPFFAATSLAGKDGNKNNYLDAHFGLKSKERHSS